MGFIGDLKAESDIAFEFPADSDEFREIQRVAKSGEKMTVRFLFGGTWVECDAFPLSYGPTPPGGDSIVVRGRLGKIGPCRVVEGGA